MCFRYPGCPRWCRPHMWSCADYRLKTILGLIKLRIGCILYGLLLVIIASGLIGILICQNFLINKADQDCTCIKNNKIDDNISQIQNFLIITCCSIDLISGVILVLAAALVRDIHT